jgi:hypothetical protein
MIMLQSRLAWAAAAEEESVFGSLHHQDRVLPVQGRKASLQVNGMRGSSARGCVSDTAATASELQSTLQCCIAL